MSANPETFWGKAGAGILFRCPDDQSIMLVKRSGDVLEPHTWGIPGGACGGDGFYDDDGAPTETSERKLWDCAKRETIEEVGYFPKKFKKAERLVFTSGSFRYTTFVVDVGPQEKENLYQEHKLNWENDDLAWFRLPIPVDHAELHLHFGVKYVLEQMNLEAKAEKILRGLIGEH